MASRQSSKNERKSPSKYGNPLETDILSYFQLWRLAILQPVGVQRHNVPHFKGLIVLYLDSRSSRAWQHFYLLSRPWEKGHFTPKTAKCPRISVPKCIFHYDDCSSFLIKCCRGNSWGSVNDNLNSSFLKVIYIQRWLQDLKYWMSI